MLTGFARTYGLPCVILTERADPETVIEYARAIGAECDLSGDDSKPTRLVVSIRFAGQLVGPKLFTEDELRDLLLFEPVNA